MASLGDPELLGKVTREILLAELPDALDAVRTQWQSAQVVGDVTVAADDLELPAPTATEVTVARVDYLEISESNFPAVFVFVSEERADTEGEQDFAFYRLNLVIRVAVQGVTLAETAARCYRYAQAVKRVVRANPTLNGLGVRGEFPAVNYDVAENPLYQGVTVQFSIGELWSP